MKTVSSKSNIYELFIDLQLETKIRQLASISLGSEPLRL